MEKVESGEVRIYLLKWSNMSNDTNVTELKALLHFRPFHNLICFSCAYVNMNRPFSSHPTCTEQHVLQTQQKQMFALLLSRWTHKYRCAPQPRWHRCERTHFPGKRLGDHTVTPSYCWTRSRAGKLHRPPDRQKNDSGEFAADSMQSAGAS